jgi:hypothetical protein
MFGGFAHYFGKRPVLLVGDFLEALVERLGKLNLGPRHDVDFTWTAV